ncbi:hypothetical protein NM688_g5431 [Phlebia brevispora]|uniref:Uncharacterized protein n=1 Tax=Phlebia brevispora TaxID=194682 RepID=A0ACC1SVI8_9APHY|nr:hypothetical protein NM688_g5431 [Phlebia brevispora]
MDSIKPLDFASGPLVWIDCEMTGLNPKTDKILEIAVLITNGDLELVDPGIQYIIRTEKDVLDHISQNGRVVHKSARKSACYIELTQKPTSDQGRRLQSGLTEACLESPYSKEYVANEVLKYIQRWVPTQRIGVLAGNSVHADRAFLVEEMPEVVEWLHYRIVDVSSIKELCRRWFPNRLPPKSIFTNNGETAHRALDDIRGSIRELQWYRSNIFAPSGAAQGSRRT